MNHRSPSVAFSLSIFTPGLGHFYAGDLRKAIIFFSLNCLFPVLFLLDLHFKFAGMITLLATGLFVQVYTMVDAARTAARNRQLRWGLYNRWYIHLILGVIVLAIRLLYPVEELLGTQSFRALSLSMQPTLQAGDIIVAQTRHIDDIELRYGDVVAFQQAESVWLFRVVGLSGDHVRLEDDFLIVNDRRTTHHQLSDLAVTIIPGDPTVILHEQFEETLPNKRRINIVRLASSGIDSSTISQRTVPFGSYFLLGDNRDNAADSRYLGAVSKDRIVAKALFILYSNDWKRIGAKL